MNDHSSGSLAARFSAAPLELRLYAVFAAVVTILWGCLVCFGSKSLKEAVVPYAGWSAGSSYMFTVYFAFALMFSKRLSRLAGITGRFAIIAILLIGIFGGYLQMKKVGANDFGNPYLRTSPMQPVWTMAIPAFWIMMLLSPRVNKFYKFRESK